MKKQSIAITLSILGSGFLSGGVWAHGTMETPVSRDYQCFLEGPENPQSEACKEAVRIGGKQPLYDWNAISQNAAGADKAFVPDGMLCSGGNVKYRGLDLARTDWKKTPIQADADGNYEFVFRGTAPHATKRWDFYITKDDYDATKALTWSDLEPAPFCEYGNVALQNGRYSMSCQLPEGKDGDQVIYNIWERSDSAETFYTCMDVTVMGTGAGNGNGGGQGGGADTGNGDTGGEDDNDNTDSTDNTDNSGDSGSSQCAVNTFESGLNYNAGDIVNNAGGTYECVIGGWCTSEADWAYEPGKGMFWTQAWKTAETCDDVEVGDTEGPGSNEGDNGNNDNAGNGGNEDPGDSTADNGSDTTDCDAPSFVSGSHYNSGDVVANAGDSYECVIGGWCSSAADWAYAPGVGLYWTQAWALADSCGGATGGGSSDGGSTEDSNDDTGSGDDHSDNGSDSETDDDSNDNSGSDDSDTDDSDADDSNGSGDDTDDSDTGDSDNSDNSDTETGDNGNDNNTDNGSEQRDHVVASYFVEWGVYGRNYHVMDMPANKLTHILYGFIPVCGPNQSLQQANASGYSVLLQQCAGKQDYEVVVHDKYAALEKSYPGDKWDDPIRGNFGQLIKLKQVNPHLKVIPSIGGWTLSDPFYSMANSAANRAVFVSSVVNFLRTYDFFDGADIDWEFPGGGGANGALGSASDRQAYVYLMRDLREGLDTLEAETGREYELTSAVGAAPSKIDAVNYAGAEGFMDYIFAMTYDFYGAWSGELGHHAGLFDYTANLHEGFDGASTINNLIAAGVPARKLVLGAAMYGRGWKGVTGAQLDNPFSGQGNGPAKGTWENGVLDYKDIVSNYLGGKNGSGVNGFTYYYDDVAEAPYLWNAATGTLISYDNPRSVTAKGSYVKQHELGGLFSWEIDADNGEIIDAMVDSMK